MGVREQCNKRSWCPPIPSIYLCRLDNQSNSIQNFTIPEGKILCIYTVIYAVFERKWKIKNLATTPISSWNDSETINLHWF